MKSKQACARQAGVSEYSASLQKFSRMRLRSGHFIVIKSNGPGESAFEAGICTQEFLHRLRVSGCDHNECFSIILHPLEKGANRFLAVHIVPESSDRLYASSMKRTPSSADVTTSSVLMAV